MNLTKLYEENNKVIEDKRKRVVALEEEREELVKKLEQLNSSIERKYRIIKKKQIENEFIIKNDLYDL